MKKVSENIEKFLASSKSDPFIGIRPTEKK